MDNRTFQSYWIAHEFKLNPQEVEDNWGDLQIAEAISFLHELYKRK